MLKKISIGACLLAASLLAQAQAGTRYQATWLEYSKGWSSIVADFDRDGHDDVYNTGHDRDDRIWYWTPAGYVPGPQVMPYVDRHACITADVNQDGLLDMYCAIGADKGTGDKLNELWFQGPGGVFTLQTGTGVEDPYGRGRHATFLDFNHDGWPDIYLTNEATDRSDGHPNINHLFVNQKDGTFVEQTTIATGSHGFQCARNGSLNGDGWDDLVVCGIKEGSHVYVNNRAGNFVEVSTPATFVPWNDVRFVDMNGDRSDDLVLVNNKNVLQVWLNTGASPFFVATPSFSYQLPANAVSVTVGDFDGNGKKDIYVVLADANCQTSLVDAAPDYVFWGQPEGGYVAQEQTAQKGYIGCGHLADTVDGDKVLLEQGGEGYKGGTYVIRWK